MLLVKPGYMMPKDRTAFTKTRIQCTVNTMSLSPWLFNSPPILMLDVVFPAMLHTIWWTLPLAPYCVFLMLLSRFMRKMGTPPPLVLLQLPTAFQFSKADILITHFHSFLVHSAHSTWRLHFLATQAQFYIYTWNTINIVRNFKAINKSPGSLAMGVHI